MFKGGLSLFILITFFSIPSHSNEFMDGYIVMANNDTVRCKIRAGDFLGVRIINQQGEKEYIGAKDQKIIAFGFIDKGKRYEFQYLDPGKKHEDGFYQRLVKGTKYKLYGRPPQVQGDLPTYVLFNSLGEFEKFQQCFICPWKMQLRDLLKDDQKAIETIEKMPPLTMTIFTNLINKE